MTPVGDPPLCDCHGEPKYWLADKMKKAGGRWRCAVKHREHCRRWREANPEKRREYSRRWHEENSDRLVRWRSGGQRTRVLLPTSADAQRIRALIDEKRAEQQAEYREPDKGGKPRWHPLDSPAKSRSTLQHAAHSSG